jgi:tetratricopeptide (TPR) repeat protein
VSFSVTCIIVASHSFTLRFAISKPFSRLTLIALFTFSSANVQKLQTFIFIVMMQRIYKTLLICLLSLSVRAAGKVYDFNETCQQAYTEITKLRIEPGKKLLEEARRQNPQNLIPYMLEGYIDFFVLFFNEDPEEYKIRKDNFIKRQAAFDSGPQNSPFYRYCRALNLLQRASVRIKFGERFGAVFDFKKGYSLIKDNQKKYPGFLPNNIVYGPLQVAMGTVPDGYKIYTNLFGMKGSIKDGMQLMRTFLNSNDQWAKLFFNEAAFYYCYLTFYIENQPAEVMKFIQVKQLDLVNNHLFAYLGTNLGINSKRTEFAKEIMLKKNSSGDYLQTPIWDFEMAFARLYHLELKEAATLFESFINNFKGRFYVKDALQKLSWSYYLQGDSATAENYRLQVIKKGSTDSDADKKALKDAKSGVWPDKSLLRARLLSDGGYNREALAILQAKTNADFPKPVDALEFVYRLARIHDDMGKDNEAIQYYLSAMTLGAKMKEYYAARAALQIAYIYEQRGQKDMAITYYQKCLDMEDHEYKDSLDQRAKSGIARCKGE